MAAATRLLRANLPRLSRLSLVHLLKSRPFTTAVIRLSSNSATKWRRFYLPPRKSLQWGIALGTTTGILCGGIALCAASSGEIYVIITPDFSGGPRTFALGT